MATKGYPSLATCGGIFHGSGSMWDFIGDFSAFIKVQIALVAEYYMLWSYICYGGSSKYVSY